MKILFLSRGDHVDYQCDCLFIGLRELFGDSVIDYNKMHHTYATYDATAASKLYGNGFTVTRVLDDIAVDRSDITTKIKNKFFDYIVYGSVWRCSDYFNEILNFYPKNRIVLVDGEDEANLHPLINHNVQYFKRELVTTTVNPISFALPTSKLNLDNTKIKDFSHITPLDRSTYIYNNEQDYYKDYAESRFGTTLKKAGWDCMRHYEIMGNGCIPYFLNIDNCPANTMTSFPKELCSQVTKLFAIKVPPTKIYERLIEDFKKHFMEKNTTKALAENFIDKIVCN